MNLMLLLQHMGQIRNHLHFLQYSLAFTDINQIGAKPLNSLPIVYTGAQTSSFDDPQDATRNLTNALFAAERLCREKYYQCIVQVFGSRIIDAAYTAKIDESGDDAFDAVEERGRVGKCSSSKGPQFDESFLRSCYSVTSEERATKLAYSSSQGDLLPSAKFLISPLEEVKIGTSSIGVPLDNGTLCSPS